MQSLTHIFLTFDILFEAAPRNYLILYLVFKIKYNISPFLIILINLFLVSNFLFNLYTDYFNLNNQIKLFSTANILKNLFLVITLMIFIFWFKQEVNGLKVLWMSQFAGFALVVIIFFRKYNWFLKTNSETFKVFFKRFFIYSSPLIVLAFWTWVNTYTDRYIIEYFLDEKSVGLYNANLGLGSKFFLLFYPFFTTLLSPLVFNESVSIREKKQVINRYAKIYVLIYRNLNRLHIQTYCSCTLQCHIFFYCLHSVLKICNMFYQVTGLYCIHMIIMCCFYGFIKFFHQIAMIFR